MHQDMIKYQTKYLKPSLPTILHPLLNICNFKGYHPKIWKTVFALLFNEPDKPQSNPSNYRPISLISKLSIILGKIITTKLYNWAETNHINTSSTTMYANIQSATNTKHLTQYSPLKHNPYPAP